MSLRTHFNGDHAVADALNSDWAQHGYRSEDDARQVASLVEDLIVHRRHIALSCRDADTLDHYSRLLVRDLRQRESIKVVPYFPSSTEMLLTRLNELLAQVTIEQAMRRDATHERDIHVFVLHDTPSLANAELTLLVQLINDLPGTELRLVLVLDSEDHDHARMPLLGKRARHWDVPVAHTPSTPVSDASKPAADRMPVLSDRVTPPSPSGAEPERSAWWQRWRGVSLRKTSQAVVAMLMLTVGSALGWAWWPNSPQAVVLSAVTEQRQWGGPIAVASDLGQSTREARLHVPAWLAQRCVGQADACAAATAPS